MKGDFLFRPLKYAPHAGQLRFHASDARFKVLIAGARFGKSLAASRDVLRDMLKRETRGWFVGPTLALAMPEYDYFLNDARKRLSLGIALEFPARQGHRGLTFVNGSEVHCLSALQPQNLLGREIDWLVLCEAAHLSRESFERFLRGRLTTRKGRLVVATTPRGHNWIEELYQRGLSGRPGWQSFRYASWDNPRLSPAEIEEARRTLSAAVFDEQFGGAFTGASGRVYAEFEPARHVLECEPPAGSVSHRGIDFGFSNPFACLWVYLDHDGRLCVFDEHYRAGATVLEHAREILRRDEALAARGILRGASFADPAARAEREALAQCGIPNQPAENALLPGISRVRQALLPRADGRPGLVIHPRCVNLIREFEGYVYEEGAGAGEPLPVKGQDHALDALRYVVMGLVRRADWRKFGVLW